MAPMAWISAFICLTLSGAERIQRHSTAEQAKWGRASSCETLQTRFHTRTGNLQKFMSDHADSDHMSLPTQGRAVMKAAGVLKALKRGKDCPWAADVNNGEEMEAVASVVRIALANNPCVPAALAEVESMDLEADGFSAVKRATSILLSENCEADATQPESLLQTPEEFADITDEDLMTTVGEVEENVQDLADEMVENPELESKVDGWAAVRRGSVWLLKVFGALMFGVLLCLACGFGGLYIGMIVGILFGQLMFGARLQWGTFHTWGALFFSLIGAPLGVMIAVPTCGSGWVRAMEAWGPEGLLIK